MFGISNTFYRAANALLSGRIEWQKEGRWPDRKPYTLRVGGSSMLWGDWITKASYGFDESCVHMHKDKLDYLYQRPGTKLVDREGVIVTDYENRMKAVYGVGVPASAASLFVGFVAACSPLGFAGLAAGGAAAVAAPIVAGHLHALGSAVRYGLGSSHKPDR